MIKNSFIGILFILMMTVGALAQDAQFSQFYANPLYLSPSFAGSTDGTRAVINFRDQWPGIPGAFITYAASIDHYFPSQNSGVGLQVLKDQAGSGQLALTTIAASYSYKMRFNRKWTLLPGLGLSYNVRSIDFYKLKFPDQMHISGNSPVSTEVPSLEKVNYPDASFSVLAYNYFYWGGISFEHLFMPNQSLINGVSHVPIKVRVYGGRKFVYSNVNRWNEESIKLAFSYKAQGKYDQLDLGAYWSKGSFVVGLWYRGIPLFKKYEKGHFNHDAFIILAGYKYKTLAFGYSYDITISRIFANTHGSHEISLIYEFNQDQRVRRKRRSKMVSCPKF